MMGCQRTDCIERPLSNLFEKLGWVVGSYPVWFFIIPLIVSASLGGGFYFLKDREDNDIERQFTPRNGPSKVARDFVKNNFPYDDFTFSSQRLHSEGNYASVIALSKDESNVLTKEAFEDIIQLNNKVISLHVDQRQLRFSNLCARINGDCVSNDILEMIEYNASRIEQTNISYPLHTLNSRPHFLGSAIGGVKKNVKGLVNSAKAVKLFYFLEDHEKADAWLKEFQRILSDEDSKNIEVLYGYWN